MKWKTVLPSILALMLFAALLLVPTGTTFAYAGFQIPGNLLSINKLPWIIIPAATTIFGVIYVWWHRRS